LKFCQKYTIAAIPHSGREPNAVWYGVRALTAIHYDFAFRVLTVVWGAAPSVVWYVVRVLNAIPYDVCTKRRMTFAGGGRPANAVWFPCL
jgi:hypothetical protein